MKLNELSLNNYRNINNCSIKFSNRVNIFVGSNGQGKTNLLESIFLVSLTKSFKTNKMIDLISFDKDYVSVSANIEKNTRNYLIEITSNKSEKKIFINKSAKDKFSDVIGLLNTILFVPEDLEILKGNPKVRRKVFNVELSKIYPKYLIYLSSYNKILKQRNTYLKNHEVDDVFLDTLDEQLVKYGMEIFNYRKEFILEINDLVNKYYEKISDKECNLTLNYLSSLMNQDFYEALVKNRSRDKIMMQSTIGIHRDDFEVYLNDIDLQSYASQGEARTFVLALKLALVEYVFQKSNEYPILLLDDVMSELDDNRQENLLKSLNDEVQVFISTTSTNNLSNHILDKAKLYHVTSGIIKEVDVNE